MKAKAHTIVSIALVALYLALALSPLFYIEWVRDNNRTAALYEYRMEGAEWRIGK
jgi:hypothetical protein